MLAQYIRDKGFQEGELKGWKDGELEGELKGGRVFLERLLTRRFGSLTQHTDGCMLCVKEGV